MEIQKLHFTITGEGYTRLLRDLFDSEEYIKCISILKTDMKEHFTPELAEKILLGGLVFTGDSTKRYVFRR